MHTKENQKDMKGAIIFGFPGMGKTTTALHLGGVIDLDFGNFREALKIPKSEESSLFLPFNRLMKYYFQDGYAVLTNEPGLIPGAKQFAEGRMYMVLPTNSALHSYADRIYQRAIANPNHDMEFANSMANNCIEWKEDWLIMASRYKIPIIEVEYLTKEVINGVL